MEVLGTLDLLEPKDRLEASDPLEPQASLDHQDNQAFRDLLAQSVSPVSLATLEFKDLQDPMDLQETKALLVNQVLTVSLVE